MTLDDLIISLTTARNRFGGDLPVVINDLKNYNLTGATGVTVLNAQHEPASKRTRPAYVEISCHTAELPEAAWTREL